MTEDRKMEPASLSQIEHRLRRHSYSETIFDDLKSIASFIQRERTLNLADVRGVLQGFLKETAHIIHNRNISRFHGDWTREKEVRDHLRKANFINDEELAFIHAFYDLMSTTPPIHHDKTSSIDAVSAAHICWYLFDLVSGRAGKRLQRKILIHRVDMGRQYELVEQFLEGLYSGDHSGDAFEMSFDRDMMEMTRVRLKDERAINLLLEILGNEGSPNSLRNRAASLLLCPFVTTRSAFKKAVIDKMETEFKKDLELNNWQVSRGIALALAYNGYEDCIIDYIGKITQRKDLLEENLDQTEAYYRDKEAAIEYYTGQLLSDRVPSENVVWGVFYLSRRADPHNKKIFGLISKRKRDSVSEDVYKIYDDALACLESRKNRS